MEDSHEAELIGKMKNKIIKKKKIPKEKKNKKIPYEMLTFLLYSQEYILKEVQNAYRSQGVEISDKHVEIIARRMISKIRVVDSGDTYLLPGSLVNFFEFTDGNKKANVLQLVFQYYSV